MAFTFGRTARSPKRALLWTTDESGKRGSGVRKPGVLGVVTDLGNFLNLIAAESIEIARRAYSMGVEGAGQRDR